VKGAIGGFSCKKEEEMVLKTKLGMISLVLAAVFLLICHGAFAGTTGKIAGRVVDVKTGEPLPGANVFVEGTTMGAASDRSGYYFIVQVPVGDYSVSVRMLGYKTITLENVRAIQDLTTTVNFTLEETVIKMPGVVVTAARPMVQPDVTSTMHIVNTDDIDIQPLRSVTEVVTRQAGAINSEGGSSGLTGGIHIRGGRSDELVYFVDGMSIHDPVLGVRGADINLNAVQEVVVQSGGYNAEYGQAMSGIVNLVTKEGGGNLTGQLRYRSDAFLPGDYNQGMHIMEADLGGPIPGIKQLKYFLSGQLETRDYTIAANNPKREADELVVGKPDSMRNTDREYYSTQGKMGYQLTPTMKVTLGGFLTRTQNGLYEEHAGLPGTEQWDENGSKYKPLDQLLSRLDKSYQVHGNWTQAISRSTFYSVNLAMFNSKRLRGIRDWENEKDRALWEDYKFIPWWRYNVTEARSPAQRDSAWNNHDYYGDQYPWGVPGSTQWGFAFGDMGLWEERITKYTEAKLDVTSQISHVHQIKFGGNIKANESEYNQAQYIYTRPDTTDSVIENCLYYETYTVHPREGAFYLQDKMEYEDLVVNAGIRMDYFDAVDTTLKDPTTAAAGWEKPSAKIKASPRLGVSFPITDKSALHVSYGRFFQMPQLRWLYTNINRAVPELRGGWPLIGNPDLSAQSTTEYEIGLAHELNAVTSLNVTGYYKDMFDVLSTRYVPNPAFGYTIYEAADYGNVKGIEFVLRNQAPKYLSGEIAYTLSVAKGTGSYEREAYYDYIANMPVSPYTGLPLVLPQTDYYLEFDRRHDMNVTVDFKIPDKEGPVMGTMRPLQNLSLSLYNQAGSGLPYTPRDKSNNIIGTINSKRMPWNWRSDLKAQKDFRLGTLDYAFFAEVTNLFNRLNIVNVYPTTGLPDDNGKMSSYGGYIQDTWPGSLAEGDSVIVGVKDAAGVVVGDKRRDLDGNGFISKDEWYKSYVNAFKDWVTDPYNFGDPRRIAIGISISW
jgi:outer membrane receptor for ferrienterochelin and colicin